MGVVKVGGNLLGGTIAASATADLQSTGSIEANRIASLFIGGSIISGVDTSPLFLLNRNATIRVNENIGSLTVKGSLVGQADTGTGASPVIISANHQLAATATVDLAFGSIGIGGSARFASILAGFDLNLFPVNGNAQIGAVNVGGNWIAGSIVAGVQDGGSPGFGDAGDTIIGGGTIARIASIVVGGVIAGTDTPGDQFGFESRRIGSLMVQGERITIISPFPLAPLTGDVTLRLIG
jgi:hypothetical protein